MAVNNVLKLGFETENEKTVSINITSPSETLNSLMIQDAMDNMIASEVLSTKSGLLKTKKYAKKVTTETTDITLPTV